MMGLELTPVRQSQRDPDTSSVDGKGSVAEHRPGWRSFEFHHLWRRSKTGPAVARVQRQTSAK